MKKLFVMLLLGMFFVGLASAGTGAIWTTKVDCVPQDANEYDIGEHVYIRGDGFVPGEYDWEITGQPGEASCDPNEIIAYGSYIVDESGYFCFDAYEVEEGDCGVYKTNFNNKFDNYHVVPEFGFVIGMLTALSAVGIFFFVRKD
jgi:hypothetical protein